jgi:hypothetical protein
LGTWSVALSPFGDGESSSSKAGSWSAAFVQSLGKCGRRPFGIDGRRVLVALVDAKREVQYHLWEALGWPTA